MELEWNFFARTHAIFAWRRDILWQAKEHPGSGEAQRYLDRIQAFDIPTIVLQTTLHMLGKFARLPNSRSFRLSYKLPCRFVFIWKHLKSVTKVLNKIRENMKMSSLSQTKTRIRSHLDFHRK